MKTLDYYLKLPYATVVRQDDEGDFIARIEELPGCVAQGPSPKEAFENLGQVKKAWLEEAIEAGIPIPEPEIEEGRLPSGKWVQRVPRTLHKKLVRCASREGVSLNQLVVSVLAEAVGIREGCTGRAIPDREIMGAPANILAGYSFDYFGGDSPTDDQWEIFQPDVNPTTIFHGGIVESLRNVRHALLPKKGRKIEALKHAEEKEADQYFVLEH